MKPWIRRTLIGVFGFAALFGGLAAWAGHTHGCWHGDPAQAKAHAVDFASRRLELDEAQKGKLNTLADVLLAQRQALVADPANPRAELQKLIAGTAFGERSPVEVAMPFCFTSERPSRLLSPAPPRM